MITFLYRMLDLIINSYELTINESSQLLQQENGEKSGDDLDNWTVATGTRKKTVRGAGYKLVTPIVIRHRQQTDKNFCDVTTQLSSLTGGGVSDSKNPDPYYSNSVYIFTNYISSC